MSRPRGRDSSIRSSRPGPHCRRARSWAGCSPRAKCHPVGRGPAPRRPSGASRPRTPAGWRGNTASTSRPSRAPAQVAGSSPRTSRRRPTGRPPLPPRPPRARRSPASRQWPSRQWPSRQLPPRRHRRRWCAGTPRPSASTSPRWPAPERADASAGRTWTSRPPPTHAIAHYRRRPRAGRRPDPGQARSWR